MKGKYDDIIDLPPPTSQKHPRMPLANRAAQFAPFAALTGYESAIMETKRLTHKKTLLAEDVMQEVAYKLQLLLNYIEKLPTIKITYFAPDANKEGGEYLTVTDQIQKYDEESDQLILLTERKISISDIVNIDSSFFDSFL